MVGIVINVLCGLLRNILSSTMLSSEIEMINNGFTEKKRRHSFEIVRGVIVQVNM